MLELVTTSKFRRDYKRAQKRGCNMDLLEEIIDLLLHEQPLAAHCRDHRLTGRYTGFRECHILPDWLLIYSIDKDRLILTASRTGTHSDLFTE